MRMNCEAVASHSLPLPVGYGLPALSLLDSMEQTVSRVENLSSPQFPIIDKCYKWVIIQFR
jgi:hypothetical protein